MTKVAAGKDFQSGSRSDVYTCKTIQRTSQNLIHCAVCPLQQMDDVGHRVISQGIISHGGS